MAAAQLSTRPYQVVVWGATGFTGKLVCEHIARDYQGRIKWAIAGRDERKLDALRQELTRVNPAVASVPLLVADAQDAAAVGAVVSQAQVVLALAGPFAKYGDNVVAQCVEHSTHYCDITGEVPWVRRSVTKHHEAAKAKGCKIVHCCGYDSVPSDLGVLMMAEWCKTQLGKKLAQAYTLLTEGKGGVSGGTIASAFNLVATEPDTVRVGTDAYYLASAVQPKHGSDKPAPYLPTWIKPAGVWAGPFVMEGCNARVVHYSNAVNPHGPYGADFRYCEMVQGGAGLAGFAKAALTSLGTILVGVAFSLAPTRALLQRVLPAPGTGPSLEAQRTGRWSHRVLAVTEEAPGVQPTIVEGTCGDQRDPGYWSTSRMILETGLALVLDAEAIASSGWCAPGGVLTPATAAGPVLLNRLRNAGFTWEVKGVVSGSGKVAAPTAGKPVTVASAKQE